MNITMTTTAVVLLVSALLLLESSAFAPLARRVTVRSEQGLFLGKSTPPPVGDDFADFPPPDEQAAEYTGSVDWDAEWKKMVKDGGLKTQERPGKDYYKSEAEIAAIRAANKATEQVNKVASNIPSPPTSFDQVKGDWRFWIAILAVLSVGSSLLAGMGMSQQLPVNASPDSYYI